MQLKVKIVRTLREAEVTVTVTVRQIQSIILNNIVEIIVKIVSLLVTVLSVMVLLHIEIENEFLGLFHVSHERVDAWCFMSAAIGHCNDSSTTALMRYALVSHWLPLPLAWLPARVGSRATNQYQMPVYCDVG